MSTLLGFMFCSKWGDNIPWTTKNLFWRWICGTGTQIFM